MSSAITSSDRINAGGQGATIEVPRSFQPDADTVIINTESRLYEFPAAQATFAPANVSQILIPQHRSRYILGGTTYLQFRVVCTPQVSLGNTMDASQSSNIRHSAAAFFGGGPTKSAAGLIDRITITAPNGQVLADITGYAQWHNLILSFAASEDYMRTATITEHAFSTLGISNAVNAWSTAAAAAVNVAYTVDVSLPLAIGLFSETKAFPLWALNGPLIVLVQWAPAEKAIGNCLMAVNANPALSVFAPAVTTDVNQMTSSTPSTFTATSSTYAGSNLSLRCRCVDVDIDYVNQQRMMMMQGKVLTYSYRQTQNIVAKLATNGSLSFNFGLNVSSLLAFFGINLMDNDCVGASGRSVCASTNSLTIGSSVANVGSWGYSANSIRNVRIFRDGTQLSTFNLFDTGRDDAFLPLLEAFGTLFSTSNNPIVKKIVQSSPDNANPTLAYVPNAIDNLRSVQGAANGGFVANGTAVPLTYGVPQTIFSLPPAWQYGNYQGGSVYAPAAMAYGISTRMCNDAEVANKGSQCSQLQITFDGPSSGTSGTGYHSMFYVYSCSVSFDGAGNCVVRR